MRRTRCAIFQTPSVVGPLSCAPPSARQRLLANEVRQTSDKRRHLSAKCRHYIEWLRLCLQQVASRGLSGSALEPAGNAFFGTSCGPLPRLIQFFCSGRLKKVTTERSSHRHGTSLQRQVSSFRRDLSVPRAKIELGTCAKLRGKGETCRCYDENCPCDQPNWTCRPRKLESRR